MYKKKYANKTELSAALSRAAKSRKNIHNCGRKPKVHDPYGKPSSVYVRSGDRDVFVRCAAARGVSTVEFMHTLAERLKNLSQK